MQCSILDRSAVVVAIREPGTAAVELAPAGGAGPILYVGALARDIAATTIRVVIPDVLFTSRAVSRITAQPAILASHWAAFASRAIMLCRVRQVARLTVSAVGRIILRIETVVDHSITVVVAKVAQLLSAGVSILDAVVLTPRLQWVIVKLVLTTGPQTGSIEALGCLVWPGTTRLVALSAVVQ